MSQIDTTNIDINYPVARQNNNSNGFRNNFSSIKTALNYVDSELTELQNQSILKTQLTNSSLNNDMNGSLIKNAQFRGTRQSVINLGNTLTGDVIINVNAADIYTGTILANSTITLKFAGWSPSGTKSEVELQIKFIDNNSFIDLSSTNIDASLNYLGNSNNKKISASINSIRLNFSTIDCGNTISVTPLLNSRKETNIPIRTPSSIGVIGDTSGDICTDTNNAYVCISDYNGSTTIWKKIQLTNI